MGKMKTEREPKSTSTQSMDQEPNTKADPKKSDPAMDAERFVIVPTTTTTKEEKQKQKQKQINQIEIEQLQFELKNSVNRSPELDTEPLSANMSVPNGYDPNVVHDQVQAQAQAHAMESSSPSFKERIDTVRDAFGRWRRIVGEATKKAEYLAGNTWQHCVTFRRRFYEPIEPTEDPVRTSPSFAEAAMGRIAQGTKVLAEGGYEKIFRHTFETIPEEQLQNSFACYLSTSAGPVMGVLYVSTEKLAYCSDSPLAYKSGTQTEWSYYKVLIPLHQLKAVNPSTSKVNASEKYIQINSVDAHEFWFMGFLDYEGAVQCLQEISQLNSLRSV